MTPFDRPAELEAALEARGYVAFEETLVQSAPLERAPELPAAGDDTAIEALAVDAFVDAVGALRASPAGQREAHRERLSNSPLEKRLIAVRAGDDVVCTAQAVIEGDLAGLYDVVTAETARGNGYATLACASLLSWAWQHGAHAAYLQVGADNAPALAIYRKLGFATAYAYHYRGLPGGCE